MNRNIHTILGCDNTYKESKIAVFGAPFDSTTSFRPGARFASAAIRNDSYGLETYSPYQDKDLEDYAVFDGGDLELPFGNTEKVIQDIQDYTAKIIKDQKMPFMIGGEHLVTLGAVRSAAAYYKDLHIVHLDAHTDLRDEYLGVKLSHATVIRRCYELTGDGRIYQFGIRSGEKSEFQWAKDHVKMCRFGFTELDNAIEELKGKPVYLTLDLDILDPGIFPGTGTPEAGGVSFSELLHALEKISRLNIVGADMNELAPVYDPTGASTATACKVLRELLLYLI